ncbi:hypothetical protein K7432_012794 [Basidiobolus ranarum]|uniref:Glycoside hydrolase/deacetylase n=1 Tax=Basidiobolus ranarum TaxID=34480 RepID=A0ABR2WKC3_9FUNG
MYVKSIFLTFIALLELSHGITQIWEDRRCGFINGIDVRCESGQCCSKYGWCGATSEHCVKSCKSQCQKKSNPLLKIRQANTSSDRVIENCQKPGTFAITFDDGPGPNTDKLLDYLKEARVKVTFFVVGEMLETPSGVATLKRAFADGHHIASHTYHHIDLAKATPRKVRQEMQRTSDIIFHTIGKRPRYMRPPYGSYNQGTLDVLHDMGYKVIYWNLDTFDWKHQDPRKTIAVYEDALKESSPGSSFITLQHDIQESTIKSTKEILNLVKSKGFRITTVPDCLDDSKLYF